MRRAALKAHRFLKTLIFFAAVFLLSFFGNGLLFAAEKISIKLAMFAAGDGIFDDLRILALESNRVFFSFTPPLSSYEILNFLSDIEEYKLSVSGKQAFDRIERRLFPKTIFELKGFSLSAGLSLGGEISVRTNDDIYWTLPDLDRPEFIRIPVNLYLMDIAQLSFEEAYQNFPGVRNDNSYINTNLPVKFDFLDGGGRPFRAFAALGKNWWNIQIGRDRLSFGGARSGNLLLSDTPDYYDFARISVFASWIKYSMVISQIPLFFNQSFVDPLIVDFSNNQDIQTGSVNRYTYIHRIDVSLGKKFSLGITEQLITGDSSIQLRFLNPFMFTHNYFSGYDNPKWGNDIGMMDNALFSIDFHCAPFKNLSFYGQWVIDEINIKIFEGGSNEPGGMGYLAGVEYYMPFKKSAALFFAEFVYADPYLYVDNSPFAASYWFRRMVGNPVSDSRYRWIGHPNGRDAITLILGSRIYLNEKLNIAAGAGYAVRGEHGIVWDLTNSEYSAAERTPTGRPEHALTFSASAEYKLTKTITAYGGAALDIMFNAYHGDTALGGMEFSIGVKYSNFFQISKHFLKDNVFGR